MKQIVRPKQWKFLTTAKKERILRRSQIEIENLASTVLPILKKVKKTGDKALLDYIKKFDKVHFKNTRSLRVTPKEIEAASLLISDEVKHAIRRAYRNIYNYHLAHKQSANKPLTENGQGVFIGSVINPIDSVALYIPRGKGSFPSMVYMLAIPALIAEVPRIVMVSPPLPDGTIDPACLYAAELCKIHEIYKFGGAHSIAALTYGTQTIEPVHKIIGPGSALVSAAKQYVSATVDIGPPAGPSESLIIADGTTNADLVAHDLCIEAEHGPNSMAVLLTHKKDFAISVAKHLNKLLEKAPPAQKKILTAVFSTYSGVIVTEDIQQSCDLSNKIAPEHLMIHSEVPATILSKIRHAGEILLGKNSPFSLANYIAGANAVLPTGGMAHSYSAVSVNDFTKESAIINITPAGFKVLSPIVQTLADYEGFHFHKKALEHREKTKAQEEQKEKTKAQAEQKGETVEHDIRTTKKTKPTRS